MQHTKGGGPGDGKIVQMFHDRKYLFTWPLLQFIATISYFRWMLSKYTEF